MYGLIQYFLVAYLVFVISKSALSSALIPSVQVQSQISSEKDMELDSHLNFVNQLFFCYQFNLPQYTETNGGWQGLFSQRKCVASVTYYRF